MHKNEMHLNRNDRSFHFSAYTRPQPVITRKSEIKSIYLRTIYGYSFKILVGKGISVFTSHFKGKQEKID